MPMLEHVIYGTDFSAGWEAANEQVPALARLLGIRRVTLVHVPDTHPLAADANVERSVAPRLAQAARDLAQRTALDVGHLLHRGTPAEGLLAAAHDLGADGIMVAGRGHSRLDGLFLGNVALNLARISDRPVVILADPTRVSATDGGPVLVATDGSSNCHAAEAAFAQLVRQGRRGMVVAVAPTRSSDEASGPAPIAAHARELADALANAEAEVIEGNPPVEIVACAAHATAALLIIGQRGHNPLTQVLLGSTAEAVCRGAPVPVLIVPAPVDGR
jgi:nucleotide-binding universal stress UspA family protein